MAKKIKTEDIFEGDLFAKQAQSAKDFSLVLKELIAQNKELLQINKQTLQGTKIATAKDVETIEQTAKSIEKTTTTVKNLQKAEKELEKTRLEELKIQKEREKAFDKFNKQQEKNFELQKKQNSVYQQSVVRLRDLKSQLKELEITGRTNGKLYKALGAEFVSLNGKVRDAEEGVGEFFRNVGNYPQQLRALQKELAGLEPGSAKFNELAARAGVLRDKINDAKDATRAFASESKFQTAKTLFSQVFDDIKNLDFAGAAEKAKTLASVVKSITFAEAAKAVTDLGAAFSNLFRALLLNPFTAIIASVAALGIGIFKLTQKLSENTEAIKENNAAIDEQRKKRASLLDEQENSAEKLLVLQGKLTEQEAQIIALRRKAGKELEELDADRKKRIQEIVASFGKEKGFTQQDIDRNYEFLRGLGLASDEVIKLKEGLEKPLIDVTNIDFIKKQQKEIGGLVKDFDKSQADTKRGIQQELETQIEILRLESLKKNEKVEKGKTKTIKEESYKRVKILKGELDETDFNLKQQEIKDNQDLFDLAIQQAEKESDYKVKKEQEEKERLRKLDEQRRKEAFDLLNQVTQRTFEEINKRKDAELQAQNDLISERKTNIQRQQELASRGLANTLEFEKKKLAESELEKKRLEQAQIRREKRQIFAKALIASLENAKGAGDIAKSFSEAVAVTTLATAFAGAFKDGVENLKGKGTGTSDSNVALLSKGESVITAKATKDYSGLATAMNSGMAEKWLMDNVGLNDSKAVENRTNYLLAQKLDKLNRTLEGKKEININWDAHDTRVETIMQDGFKKTIKHVRSKPKI